MELQENVNPFWWRGKSCLSTISTSRWLSHSVQMSGSLTSQRKSIIQLIQKWKLQIESWNVSCRSDRKFLFSPHLSTRSIYVHMYASSRSWSSPPVPITRTFSPFCSFSYRGDQGRGSAARQILPRVTLAWLDWPQNKWKIRVEFLFSSNRREWGPINHATHGLTGQVHSRLTAPPLTQSHFPLHHHHHWHTFTLQLSFNATLLTNKQPRVFFSLGKRGIQFKCGLSW